MMNNKRKVCIGGSKTPYETPTTEVIQVLSDGLMQPHSWNTGEGGENLPIHEGDYFDDDDDGKGAKQNDLWSDYFED